MRRVRRKARQRVSKEMDIVSATHSNQSVMEATSEALRKVEKENEVSCMNFVLTCSLFTEK